MLIAGSRLGVARRMGGVYGQERGGAALGLALQALEDPGSGPGWDVELMIQAWLKGLIILVS